MFLFLYLFVDHLIPFLHYWLLPVSKHFTVRSTPVVFGARDKQTLIWTYALSNRLSWQKDKAILPVNIPRCSTLSKRTPFVLHKSHLVFPLCWVCRGMYGAWHQGRQEYHPFLQGMVGWDEPSCEGSSVVGLYLAAPHSDHLRDSHIKALVERVDADTSTKEALHNLLYQCSKVCTDWLGQTREATHTIQTTDEQPIREKAYWVSPMKKGVIEEVKIMVKDCIQPSTSPWALWLSLLRRRLATSDSVSTTEVWIQKHTLMPLWHQCKCNLKTNQNQIKFHLSHVPNTSGDHSVKCLLTSP